MRHQAVISKSLTKSLGENLNNINNNSTKQQQQHHHHHHHHHHYHKNGRGKSSRQLRHNSHLMSSSQINAQKNARMYRSSSLTNSSVASKMSDLSLSSSEESNSNTSCSSSSLTTTSSSSSSSLNLLPHQQIRSNFNYFNRVTNKRNSKSTFDLATKSMPQQQRKHNNNERLVYSSDDSVCGIPKSNIK